MEKISVVKNLDSDQGKIVFMTTTVGSVWPGMLRLA